MLALFKLTTLLLPGATGFVPKVIVVPPGIPAVAARVIGLVKPLTEFVPKVIFMMAGAGQVAAAGDAALKVNPDATDTGLSQTPRP